MLRALARHLAASLTLAWLVLAWLGLAWLGLAWPAFAQEIGRYDNARFGYSICTPDGLTPQGEAENGDGQTFLSGDGAKLIVYGGFNALDETLAQRRAATIERLGPASYSKTGRGWFVVSGQAGEEIYYVRTSLKGDVFTSFEFTYPAAEAARWNPVAATLSRCFKAP